MARNNEAVLVECPFIAQLAKMGWEHKQGDKFIAIRTERRSFFDVLLENRIKDALFKINKKDKPWLDEARVDDAINQLKRIKGENVVQANEAAYDLIMNGAVVKGESTRNTTIQFIDFENWAENDFLAINQFRVNKQKGNTV